MRKSCRGCKLDCGDRVVAHPIPVCMNCKRIGDMEEFAKHCYDCKGLSESENCHFISNGEEPITFEDITYSFIIGGMS